MNSKFPIVCLTADRGATNALILDLMKRPKISLTHEMPWLVQAFRFEELISNRLPEWPFDFGLVFSGTTVNTMDKMLKLDKISHRLIDSTAFARGLFSKRVDLRYLNQSLFYRLIKSKQLKELWDHYLASWIMNDVSVLYALKNSFQYGYTDALAEELANLLHNQYFFLRLFGWSSGKIGDVLENMIKHYRERDIRVGYYVDSYVQHGEIAFFNKYGETRNETDALIHSLRRKHNPMISLDYASWLDGFESNGLKIEQFIKQRKYSSLFPRSGFKAEIWSHNIEPEQRYIISDERKAFNRLIDIILDYDTHRIIIGGNAVTSKNLHSQRITITLIETLLNNLGRAISGTDLPIGSYRDRNEVQSKIISPLQKVIKKRLKRTLPIEITGGLGKHYKICLKPTAITFAMLRCIE